MKTKNKHSKISTEVFLSKEKLEYFLATVECPSEPTPALKELIKNIKQKRLSK